MNPIFTIGHSDHDQQQFIELLRAHGIGAVADVRSSPYSGRFSQFNREALQAGLRAAGIQYVFLGDELGARRSEEDCYVNGQALYERIAETPSFQCGLKRLTEGAGKMRIVIMCAEREPLECHRCVLICRHLKVVVPSIWHILADGSLESHEQTEMRLLQQFKLAGEDLFLSKAEMLDAAYERQGKRIAYKEEAVLLP